MCTFFHLYYFVECSNLTFENSWYIISADRNYGHSSRDTCQSLGGDLISIETEGEWNFINDEIQRRNTKNYDNKWRIGLTKKAGNWTWVSGSPLTIYKWGEGEPSAGDDAAFMYKRSSNGRLGVFGSDNGESWRKKRAYICEIPKGE